MGGIIEDIKKCFNYFRKKMHETGCGWKAFLIICIIRQKKGPAVLHSLAERRCKFARLYRESHETQSVCIFVFIHVHHKIIPSVFLQTYIYLTFLARMCVCVTLEVTAQNAVQKKQSSDRWLCEQSSLWKKKQSDCMCTISLMET